MQTTESPKNSHLNELQRAQFRLWLQKQFTDRCQKNPRYSLRAFAQLLNLDASTVSQILSGKRAPSRKASLEICERLSVSARDLKVLGLAQSTTTSDNFIQLSLDTQAVLADWYHFAILELTFVKNFDSDPRWIAKQLSLSVIEVRAAVERMLRLGLLDRQNGRLVKTHGSITNHTGLSTTVARKTLQKQILTKALAAIDEVPQEEKDITSLTMSIDPKNLDIAREMIKRFRRELCALLETGEQQRVYNLAVQLYPISKNKTE